MQEDRSDCIPDGSDDSCEGDDYKCCGDLVCEDESPYSWPVYRCIVWQIRQVEKYEEMLSTTEESLMPMDMLCNNISIGNMQNYTIY